MNKIAQAAVEYWDKGLVPIKVKKGSKAPAGGKGWQAPNYTYTPDVEQDFEKHSGGVGLRLGECAAGYLVDVDLDSSEAIQAADHIIIDGYCGRSQRSDMSLPSHYWYLFPNNIPTKKFIDLDGSMMMELRGEGLQTLAPPSKHPSGCDLAWTAPIGSLMEPDSAELILQRIRLTAAITLIARHWPEEGSRQYLVLALTGYLLHNGYDKSDVRRGVEGLFSIVGEHTRERMGAFTSSVKSYEIGRNITGGPTIASILGDDVFKKFVDFLGVEIPVVPEEAFEEEESTVISQLVSVYDLVHSKEWKQDEVVEGLIWAGKTHWLYSDPNAGKTMLALAIALHVAAGKEFAGRHVKQGPVVVIEEDSSLAVIASYLDNFASLYGIDFRDLPVYFNEEQGIRIYRPGDVDKIHDLINSAGSTPSIVIYDSCERILPSNSFNSREVDPLDRLLKTVANRGIANLVLDHTNKSQYDNPMDMDVLYGSRAKSAIADIMVQLQGSIKDGVLNAKFTKFRGDTPPAVDIFYDADQGFSLKDRPGVAKTPYEREIVAWFLGKVRMWIPINDLETALLPIGVEDDVYSIQRLHRTLDSLATRRILRKYDDGECVQYRYNA